ncbi:MAG: aminoacyl-histidine dipeptidase [Chlorobium sp.]|nr:MAG: aminoacyl-histidine dipeptidase [Chlorobium sp.]
MIKNILQLNPPSVWKHFYSLTRIPRPSGKEEQIRAFISDFGKNLGLETLVDDVGNVIIRKPATSGMENRQKVILQAHLDMVPQKNSGKVHDFDNDPIETVVDGEWVRANGTTLGADNGMGVAAAMAVLESDRMQHGPIEALFTSNEEAGMTGAAGLKLGVLKGQILINLDSEDEGTLFIGCAGGTSGQMTFRYKEEALWDDCAGFRINVSGLQGGHSGLDIHLGRGNANKIMNRILYQGHLQYGLRLAAIDGGSLSNAIPRESSAHVAIPSAKAHDFLDDLSLLTSTIKQELSLVEPAFRVEAVVADVPGTFIDQMTFTHLMKAIYACPNGVMRMSDGMDDVVETSNNLAIVTSGNGVITVDCLLRSSVDSAKADLQVMIKSVFDLAGAESLFDEGYPGWKLNPDSLMLQKMIEIYAAKFGKNPEVKAIHAGLECGILGGTYPGLEMISFGPSICFPHSPAEKVEIASVQKFWDFLVEVLANIPAVLTR